MSTPATEKKTRRVEKVGVVVSDRMSKSRVIEVHNVSRHPMYGKTMRRRVRFMAHDENNVSKTGDTVRVFQTRPLSKRKRWVIVGILGETNDAGKRQET